MWMPRDMARYFRSDFRLVIPAGSAWCAAILMPSSLAGTTRAGQGALVGLAGIGALALVLLVVQRYEHIRQFRSWPRMIFAAILGVAGVLGSRWIYARIGVDPFAGKSMLASAMTESGVTHFWVTEALKLRLIDALSAMPDFAKGLIPGVIIGDDSRLPEELDAAMRSLSLTHLTAVSGAHISLVLGLILGVIGRKRAVLGAGIGVSGLLGLIAIVGPEASVLRASVMGVLLLVAVGIARDTSPMPLISACVLAVAIIDPALAASLGFQLSALTTAAIIAFGYALENLLSLKIPRLAAQLYALPFIAGIVSMPLIAPIQSEISVWSILANILVAPVVAPLTLCGLLAYALLAFWPALAALLLAVCSACTWWMAAVTLVLSKLPGNQVNIFLAAAINCAVCVLVLFAAHVLGKRPALHLQFTKRQRTLNLWPIAIGGAAVCAAGVGIASFWPSSRVSHIPPDWEVIQCDVGQGNALLARSRDETVLIDTGPEGGGIEKCLRGAGVQSLDLLIISHFDADHVRALAQVLETVAVQKAWVSTNLDPEYNSKWALGLLEANGVTITSAHAGDQFSGWISVVHPSRPSQAVDASNLDSLVVFLETERFKVLDLADVPSEVQDSLAGRVPPADVVVVAHHGAASQSEKLAHALRPQISLISVGENSYGHPTERALEIWAAPLELTTLDCGLIALAANGVSTSRACALDRYLGSEVR